VAGKSADVTARRRCLPADIEENMVSIFRRAATVAAVAFVSFAIAFALPISAQAKNSGGGSSNSQTKAAPPKPTPKIKGESQDKQHPDPIHLESAPSGNAGKAKFNEFTIKKTTDHSSP
jgi:hypothetical protein